MNESPWPLLSSISSFFLVIGLLKWFYSMNSSLFMLSFLSLCSVSFFWWADISAESAFQGVHTKVVETSMSWGMILFILSECFFFLSFFWAFFHASLSPDVGVGACWPPVGISSLSAFSVPLLNTVVLVCSGVTLTWGHHALKEKNVSLFNFNVLLTITLGLYFTSLQAMEYFEASFMMSDSSYGSTFFIATGFHGIHVIVGTLFIMASFTRSISGQFSKTHHFGFEASAWYWHFVDIVWLSLYILIYWWSAI